MSADEHCQKDVQNVQYADQTSKPEEVRVGLDEHPLDFVHLGATGSALLLRGLREAIRHRREQLELPVAHRLEGYFEGKSGSRGVDLDVLRAQMPEVVREDDRLVEAFRAGLVALGQDRDICAGS